MGRMSRRSTLTFTGGTAIGQSLPFRLAERARSSSGSTYMNERQLLGSEKARANGRDWVAPSQSDFI